MSGAFRASARVYDALLRHKDYESACRTICEIVDGFSPQASTLLDVGCGTGRHLEHLRRRFAVEGVDRSREMLAIARERCPDVPLHEDALEEFDLGRRFDAVTCLFGSVAYATSVGALHRAVQRLTAHVAPAGVLVVEPWVTSDRFIEGRLVLDTVDDADLKVARVYRTAREGRVSVFDSTYVIGTADGVTSFEERQELGLFTDAEYRAALSRAGAEIVDTSRTLFGYGLYVARVSGTVRGNG